MTMHAEGTFEVQSEPQEPYDSAPGAKLGRVTITKQFSGELEGTSVVEMLSAVTEVEGSAGYVAVERITGSLKGRQGTFVALHTGIMARGRPALNIAIVPDSGTDELKGISGTMDITIDEGQHSYSIDYTLA